MVHPFRARPWQDVAHALRALGVQERHFLGAGHMILVRGGVVRQALKKTFNVSAAVQRKLVAAFGLNEKEYLRCLPVPSTVLVPPN